MMNFLPSLFWWHIFNSQSLGVLSQSGSSFFSGIPPFWAIHNFKRYLSKKIKKRKVPTAVMYGISVADIHLTKYVQEYNFWHILLHKSLKLWCNAPWQHETPFKVKKRSILLCCSVYLETWFRWIGSYTHFCIPLWHVSPGPFTWKRCKPIHSEFLTFELFHENSLDGEVTTT